MPAYYFAMEGYHAGDKPNPATDTVITIQYQKIDLTTGEPLEKLTILKAWEDSEKSIVTRFYNQFLKAGIPVTHFIPVGINLDYAFELILAKCRQYHLPALTSHQLYYQRPRFDLAPVIVLLNDGRFKGASLDTFSAKKSDAGRINTWYERKEFKPIEHTLQDEAETFLKLLQYLSKYKTRLGVTRKGEPVRHRPAEPAPPARTEKAYTPRRDVPAPSPETPKKRAATKTSASHNISAQIAKAQPPRKSHASSRPASPHASKPLTPLRKHTPTKSSPATGKRG
jgi:hypothetical protein